MRKKKTVEISVSTKNNKFTQKCEEKADGSKTRHLLCLTFILSSSRLDLGAGPSSRDIIREQDASIFPETGGVVNGVREASLSTSGGETLGWKQIQGEPRFLLLRCRARQPQPQFRFLQILSSGDAAAASGEVVVQWWCHHIDSKVGRERETEREREREIGLGEKSFFAVKQCSCSALFFLLLFYIFIIVAYFINYQLTFRAYVKYYYFSSFVQLKRQLRGKDFDRRILASCSALTICSTVLALQSVRCNKQKQLC